MQVLEESTDALDLYYECGDEMIGSIREYFDKGDQTTVLALDGYCYANAEPSVIYAQNRLHDPDSPFLTGDHMDGDKVHDVPQESWIDRQESLF